MKVECLAVSTSPGTESVFHRNAPGLSWFYFRETLLFVHNTILYIISLEHVTPILEPI
jgi:hypothetical protein